MKETSSFVIAIAGGSGSGKSLLAQALREEFGAKATAFPFDAYNKDQSHLTLAERNALNYDIPDAYDVDRYLADLLELKSGKTIALPLFDYASHTRKKETLPLKSAPIIITEGFLVLTIPETHRYFDFTIYVDADGDVRLARRILRDQNERGYPPAQVIEQYLSSVKPMHEKYIEPCKSHADFVFANNGRNGLDPAEMKRLMAILQKKIAEH
jgi:uridine kinase